MKSDPSKSSSSSKTVKTVEKTSSVKKSHALKASAGKKSPDGTKIRTKKISASEPEKKKPSVSMPNSVKKSSSVKKSVPETKSVMKSVPVKKTDIAENVQHVHHKEHLHIKKVKLLKSEQKMFRDLLLQERSQFGTQIKFHADEALSSRKGRAGMATHMADLGSDNFRHDFELGLLSDEADVMEMIDEALQRLEDSEYGICLDCGARIPNERLMAKPYARYCVKCKSARESMEDSGNHRR